nr:MAG TPA: hypothetical protein [Caudoviricetes sp.]
MVSTDHSLCKNGGEEDGNLLHQFSSKLFSCINFTHLTLT